jgi:hypothetical protein
MRKTKSILINENYSSICAFCGKPLNNKTEHHLLFGKDRAYAEQDGIKLPACDNCHTMGKNTDKIHGNIMAEKLSRIAGQLAYEKQKVSEGFSCDEARESFRKRYGKSFL